MRRDEDVYQGAGDKGRKIRKDVRGIKRINKGDGREWKGLKICAGERGIKGERRIDVRGG
jgi:hypothetical protein